ncbi:MAG: response regulator transcription factor [Spirochaetaceae bacterium]|nr:response regulator transcription factor [Spirochaetaceae bacterium]
MNRPILVIEDDTSSAHWIKVYLERAGYAVVLSHDGVTGLESARKVNPAMIVLDIMLPGLDGREICRILRKESDVPIIMLTARGAKSDKIESLSEGADDYIVKPFDPDELIVRIKAVLRRYKGNVRSIIKCGLLYMDERSRKISIDGDQIELSKAQYTIMAVFMNHPNTILSRSQLIDQAFDTDFEAFDRAIDSHIRRLRKLIHRKNYEPIKTYYGSGYKLECPEK